MIKKIILSALIIFTAPVFLNFSGLYNFTAQEKKSEITAAGRSAQDSKNESSMFSASADQSQSIQDDKVLYKVAFVIIIIWAGISVFLFMLERRVKKIESALKD